MRAASPDRLGRVPSPLPHMSRRERIRRRQRHRGHPIGRALGIFAFVLFAGVAIAALSFVGWVVSVAESAPSLSQLKPQTQGQVSEVFDSDGHRLGYIPALTLRSPVTSSQIPTVVKQATVAIEDRRFYKHKGVDYWGVVRAAYADLKSHDKDIQGGSTLTMQLIKQLYLPNYNKRRSIKLKIEQAKLAEELEVKHNKAWILTEYLNDVPYGTSFGQEAVGIGAAARIFFDKRASELTLPEAALLAGLPQAPTTYNPFSHPDKARSRRTAVLQAMVKSGYITEDEALHAEVAPLGLKRNTYYTAHKEAFVFDYVLQELYKRYGKHTVQQGGLKIYTTIDVKKQREAREAIAGVLNEPNDPSASVVTTDPANGHILAMASSASYGKTKFNYAAQAHRQPGSTFKAFVLMTGLKQGMDPNKTYYNSHPLEPGWLPGYPTYGVKTYANDYSGGISVTQATLKSDNTVYAQMDADFTPGAVTQTAIEMGVPASRLHNFPAEGLGGMRSGVSALEMSNAFATLASGGYRNTPTAIKRVVFPNHKVQVIQTKRVRTIDDALAAEETKVLHENVLAGTGQADNYGCPGIAGKTGTTTNHADAWFVGYTPKLSTAVWIGYPNQNTPMVNVHGGTVQGGTLPSFIWHNYMVKAHGSFCGDFKPPSHPFVGSAYTGVFARSAPVIKKSVGPDDIKKGHNGSGGAGAGDYNNPNIYQTPPTGHITPGDVRRRLAGQGGVPTR